jgi:hypothetical protein
MSQLFVLEDWDGNLKFFYECNSLLKTLGAVIQLLEPDDDDEAVTTP